MKINKEFNDFVYFMFPFTDGFKKLLHFLHFKLMVTLLVTCLTINIIFESFVNDTFSNLKLYVFIITGFICSNKYVKQVVLINHSWISPTLQMRTGVLFILQKIEEGTFSPKKGKVGKIVVEGC